MPSVICPACKAENPSRRGFCKVCGEPLPEVKKGTLVVHKNGISVPEKKRRYSTSELGINRTIRARVGEGVRVIRLSGKKQIVLGRIDDGTGAGPDIDFSRYSAFEEGVSRLHAAMRLVDGRVEIRDLKSTNGTFLNEQRVSSADWRPVRDGDRLRLGELEMSLHFKS